MSTAEMLANYGLHADAVQEIIRWHLDEVEHEARLESGALVVRLLQHLFAGHSDADVRIRLTAMAFAFQLEHLSGYRTQGDAAVALGCSQQAISSAMHAAKQALTPR